MTRPDTEPPGRDLTRLDPGSPPRGLVLMLHGGTQESLDPVGPRSASWRRAARMQRSLAPRLHEQGLAVWLLRYAVRGWNKRLPVPSPVPDARWALGQVRGELGDGVPIVLLGHSMGARTAVAVADDPSVVGVAALAPWFAREDPVQPLAGKHLAAAHGRSDKITSARLTRDFVRRATAVAATTEFHDMGRVGHYMLRRIPAWNEFAATRATSLSQRSPTPDTCKPGSP